MCSALLNTCVVTVVAMLDARTCVDCARCFLLIRSNDGDDNDYNGDGDNVDDGDDDVVDDDDLARVCRYEAHALKVAQHRKGGGGGSRKAAGSRPIPARSIFEKGAAVADEEGCAEMEVEGEGDRKWDFSKNDWA
jgi:hypothetical protein